VRSTARPTVPTTTFGRVHDWVSRTLLRIYNWVDPGMASAKKAGKQ